MPSLPVIQAAPPASPPDNGAMDALVRSRDVPPRAASAGPDRTEIFLALAAFAVLCLVVLSAAPHLVEPDDYAYRASIVAMTHGHFLTLSTAQILALGRQLPQGPLGLV